MKKLLTASVALVLASSAWANSTITAANNEIGLAIGGQNISYHEFAASPAGDGPDGYMDSQIGTMPALSLDVTRQGTLFGIQDVYLQASLSGAWGENEYTTGRALYQWCNGIPGKPGYCTLGRMWYGSSATKTQEVWIDAFTRLGKAFLVSRRAQLTPYLEIGGHFWDRNASQTPDATSQGIRNSDTYWNLNAGAGVLGQYVLTDRLVLGLDLTALEIFSANAHVNGVRYPLGSRPMLVGTLSADYAINKRLHLTAAYSVQRFRYGASPNEACNLSVSDDAQCHVQGSYEPADLTTAQTVMLGLAWSY